MSAPILSFELLDALRDRWTRGGLTLVSNLEPGLSDTRIDELTQPLGLSLPPELRTWFAWRNGAARHPWTPSLDLWSLEDAIRETQLTRQIEEDSQPGPVVPEDIEFSASWLMFSGADGSGAFVNSNEHRATSSIGYWDPEQGPVDTGVPSLGRLVEIAIEAWDSGWYVRWEPAGWVIDDDRQLDTFVRFL